MHVLGVTNRPWSSFQVVSDRPSGLTFCSPNWTVTALSEHALHCFLCKVFSSSAGIRLSDLPVLAMLASTLLDIVCGKDNCFRFSFFFFSRSFLFAGALAS